MIYSDTITTIADSNGVKANGVLFYGSILAYQASVGARILAIGYESGFGSDEIDLLSKRGMIEQGNSTMQEEVDVCMYGLAFEETPSEKMQSRFTERQRDTELYSILHTTPYFFFPFLFCKDIHIRTELVRDGGFKNKTKAYNFHNPFAC